MSWDVSRLELWISLIHSLVTIDWREASCWRKRWRRLERGIEPVPDGEVELAPRVHAQA
jgi:hypothetical protein